MYECTLAESLLASYSRLVTAAALQKRPPRITLRHVMDTLSKRLDTQDKSLLDVINHMSHMEQRQGKLIEANTAAIVNVRKGITGLNGRIDLLEERLTRRIDALEEDLTATMLDTIKIRKFVSMPLPEED